MPSCLTRTGVDQLVRHQSVIYEAVIMQSIVRGRILAVIIASLSAGCSPADNERAETRTTVQHLFVGGQIFDGTGDVPYVADLGVSE